MLMMSRYKKYLWSPIRGENGDPSHVGLIQLAVPMLLESILRSLVNMIDVAFLSRVSDSVVSAVSVGTQYIIICQIIANAVATGTIVCINQAIGMKNHKKVNMLATIAVIANLALGLLFGAAFLLGSDALLIIMRLDEVGMRSAAVYMRICGGCMCFQSVAIVFNSLCRSMGRTKAPLAINLLTNVINVIGNYLAVYHPELLGLEPVAGVAAASVLSIIGGMLLGAAIAHRAGVRLSLKYLKPFPRDDFKLALSIGIPGGINNLSYSLSTLLTTSIISITGTVMVATKVYVTNLVQYVALVGMSISFASNLMIGYRIGEGDIQAANEIRSLVTRAAIASNVFFSVLLYLFRNPLLRFFTDSKLVLEIAQTIFLIDLFVEIGRAMNNSISGALTAAGDVKYQMFVNQLSAWLVSVGGAYVFGILCGWNLVGVWIAFALDELTRGILLLRRWQSQKWVSSAMERRQIIARV